MKERTTIVSQPPSPAGSGAGVGTPDVQAEPAAAPVPDSTVPDSTMPDIAVPEAGRRSLMSRLQAAMGSSLFRIGFVLVAVGLGGVGPAKVH